MEVKVIRKKVVIVLRINNFAIVNIHNDTCCIIGIMRDFEFVDGVQVLLWFMVRWGELCPPTRPIHH